MTQDLFHRSLRQATRWRNRQRIQQIARQVAVHSARNSAVRTSEKPVNSTDLIASAAPITGGVAFFNATTRLDGFTLNAAFDLLTSWSLRLSGVPVRHFVCRAGMTHCVLGTNHRDLRQPPPCEACISQSRLLFTASDVTWFDYQPNVDLAAAIQDLSVDALSGFEFPFTLHPVDQRQGGQANSLSYSWQADNLSSDEQANSQLHSTALSDIIPLGSLVLPSVRWALRRHHLQDDPDTRGLLREYILSADSLAVQFAEFLKAYQPATVVIFNGVLYPEAAARWVANQLNVRSVAFEVGFQPYSVFFTEGEPTAYPVVIPDHFELDQEQTALLDAQLEKRFQGKFTMAGIRFWPEMRSLDPSLLEKTAGFRQVVPVFTNVVYDSSQVHANTLFSNMFDWLELVLEIILRHPETLFVIRAHPDEKRPVSNKISNESVHDWVYRHQVDQLPNVLFIEPDEFISSYELIQRSKFVMVYNSSIGLEATLLGSPVICGGKARYTQYPSVFLPESPAALKELTESFLQADRIEVPAEFKRNARRFLYYQFYKISLPMDEFLQEGEKQGFVYLRPFSWQQLLPENSPTMHILHDGILNHKPFVLGD